MLSSLGSIEDSAIFVGASMAGSMAIDNSLVRSLLAILGTLYICCLTRVNGIPTQTALAVPVRTSWLGLDGNWSPVSIRVGDPPQWVDLFVSTVSEETWVVGPGGCDRTTKCQDERGGLFHSNESSTWDGLGFYPLGLDPQLGFGGYGAYGFDALALSDHVSVPSQILGVINTTEYWVGYLGLGIKPTNFTDAEKPTFLSSMVENQSLIPSHSYGFTAGAHYRLKSVPASLTLGGYDTNRFESNDVSFSLDPDQYPVVALSGISVNAAPLPSSNVSTEWPSDSLALLSSESEELYTIDSSTPYLWLPEHVCEQFEKALGLTYNDDLQLYGFGNRTTQHQALLSWNLTFTFTVADSPGSSNVVDLALPYDAFDLQLSYPFPGLNATELSAPTNYFPLRKAANSTQYTIGRAFLQETYLIVDYERNNFSIHQAIFNDNALNDQRLVDINRPKNSTLAGPQVATRKRLSTGTKLGIIIGSVCIGACVALVTSYTICLRRRRRLIRGSLRTTTVQQKKTPGLFRSNLWKWILGRPTSELPPEVDGSTQQPIEASTEGEITELASSSLTELQGKPIKTEHRAAQGRVADCTVYAMGYDPEKPVELDDERIMVVDSLWNQSTSSPSPSPSPSPSHSRSSVGLRHGGTNEISLDELSSNESQVATSTVSPVTPETAER